MIQIYVKTSPRVGADIKARRKERGLSQIEAAKLFEITQSTLSRIESGVSLYLPFDRYVEFFQR